MGNFLTNLIGGSAAQPIEAVGSIVKTVFGDKGEKLSHDEVMARIAQQPGMVQAEINKVEAGHRSIFVAGWRPFIGWICGISLGFYFIPQYVVATIIWVQLIAANDFKELVAYPSTAEGLFQLVLALLGMAALRTGEKLAGKSK